MPLTQKSAAIFFAMRDAGVAADGILHTHYADFIGHEPRR